jgi:RES domain-containing protein
MAESRNSKAFVLDTFTARDLTIWEKQQQKLADFSSSVHHYLSEERLKVFDAIKLALNASTQSFELSSWHRVVDFQYCMHPLSALGSRLDFIGGRFNVGQIDPMRFPAFPALYLAEDFETAFREKFNAEKDRLTEGLSTQELALADTRSLASVLASGKLDRIIDITEKESLQPFVDVIKKIKFTRQLRQRARQLKVSLPKLIRDSGLLCDALHHSRWKQTPALVGLPSTPQMFGQLCFFSGIEAVVYSSSKGDKRCIAIFPENIKHGRSFIQLDGAIPNGVEHLRMDTRTWNKFV